MAVNLSPCGNDAPFVDSNGDPLSGGLLYTYTAGSSTPQNTYTTSAGSVANANPIVLGSTGYPTSGGSVVSIWLTAGVSYKFVLTTSAGTVLWTRDNISGINDTTVTIDEWVSGPAPTYISATSFTLAGDQTSTFHVGRRLKTTNSGGTIYSTITASAYGALTTITVVNDSGTLDSGLSAVSYALVSSANTSIPRARGGLIYPDIIAIGRNIAARTNSGTPNSKVDATADQFVVQDTTGNTLKLSTVSVTSDITASGANGLDTGAEANSTWYYHWIIATEGGTVAGLISASATAPTMPSGYTYKGLISAVYNSSGGNFVPYRQLGNKAFYETAQTALNGGTQTAETAIALTAFVPSIAQTIFAQVSAVLVNNAGAGTNTVGFRVVSGSGFASLVARDSFAGGADAPNAMCEFPNISQNIYYINIPTGTPTTATASLFVLGFSLPGTGQ